MKNKIFLSLITVAGLLSACSSDLDTADVSTPTDFAVFTLKGSSEILLEKGTPYEEPGATALEAGVPVTVTTTSTGIYRGGELDVNVADNYVVSYSAVNKDGFEASASRNVIVAESGDLVSNIAGLYRSTVVRNGISAPEYEDMEYVLIWQNADGTFQLSDGIGGYYAYGRGYGSAYFATGAKVTVNGLNDYTFGPDFSVGAFGGVAKITEMTADPEAKTIDFKTDWDSTYTFAVHLEQVQF